jgi:hypothetical protein
MGGQLQLANEDYAAEQEYVYKLESKNKILKYFIIGLGAAVLAETIVVIISN